MRIAAAFVLLAALRVPASGGELPAFVGYSSEMPARERVELLARWGYFDEALAEIDRLDAEKYAPLRERWLHTDPRIRRILRRADPESEAYLSVPAESRRLGELLREWQRYMGISREEAARAVGEWKEELRERRERFEAEALRFGLPRRTHPEEIRAIPCGLGGGPVPETCVLYRVLPEGRILRSASQEDGGRLFLKVLAPESAEAAPSQEVALGGGVLPRLRVLEPGERRLLVLEQPQERAGEPAALRAFAFDGGRLYEASRVEGGTRRPLGGEFRSSDGDSSEAELQDGGRRLRTSRRERSLRDVLHQSMGVVDLSSVRDYQWDGKDFALSSGTDSVHLTGTLFRAMSYVQALPEGRTVEWRPSAGGWDLRMSTRPAGVPSVLAAVPAGRPEISGEVERQEFPVPVPGAVGTLFISKLRLAEAEGPGPRPVERMEFELLLTLPIDAPAPPAGPSAR